MAAALGTALKGAVSDELLVLGLRGEVVFVFLFAVVVFLRGLSASVVREYCPPWQPSNGSNSYCGPSRWQFAVDEKAEVIAAPFPASSTRIGGSFLLFDLRRSDCCREIAATPAAATMPMAEERPPFELFGCCCLLPRVLGDVAHSPPLQEEVLIHPLQHQQLPPLLYSPTQQTRICGRKRWDAEALEPGHRHLQRFDCTYTWDCFCNGAVTTTEQQQQQDISSACCALLRLGGWPSAAATAALRAPFSSAATFESIGPAAAAAAAAKDVGGGVFVGASSWGLHLLVAAPPDAV